MSRNPIFCDFATKEGFRTCSSNEITFKQKVYNVVASIPRGKTMTYQEVARLAGSPRAYRAVGNIMNRNLDTRRVPCHRVVRSDGTPGGYSFGVDKKVKILKSEGAL